MKDMSMKAVAAIMYVFDDAPKDMTVKELRQKIVDLFGEKAAAEVEEYFSTVDPSVFSEALPGHNTAASSPCSR